MVLKEQQRKEEESFRERLLGFLGHSIFQFISTFFGSVVAVVLALMAIVLVS